MTTSITGAPWAKLPRNVHTNTYCVRIGAFMALGTWDEPRRASASWPMPWQVCLGVLAHHDAVAAAQKHYDPAHPAMSARLSGHRCRQCHAAAHTGSGSSAKGKECGASLLSLARLCSREMVVLAVAQVVVDVCRPCELASLTGGARVGV